MYVKITVFWNMTPYSPAVIHQCRLGSTVMSVNLYETARRRVTGDGCIYKALLTYLLLDFKLSLCSVLTVSIFGCIPSV
jgi:hypothetical protein